MFTIDPHVSVLEDNQVEALVKPAVIAVAMEKRTGILVKLVSGLVLFRSNGKGQYQNIVNMCENLLTCIKRD